MSTRPTYAAVEAGQLGEYIGYQVMYHVIDKRPVDGGACRQLTLAEVSPGEVPGTVRVTTAEYPEYHTDIDVAQQIQVYAPLGARSFAGGGSDA